MKFAHLFGPVISRRLGISLGVDLVPYKYCPLNCVYCEVQRTTHLSTQREEYFPLATILDELDRFLRDKPKLDHITFSGAGEPCLYSRIGEIISHIKQNYPQYKLALLTNGVLLGDELLRSEILPCDVILPSLDAASQEAYERLNRPMPGLLATDLINNLISLRNEYSGQIWLEVFILPGVNDSIKELSLLRDAIALIKPDLIQLNSLDRPGAEDWVTAADIELLGHVRDIFSSSLDIPVEIISKAGYSQDDFGVDREARSLIESLLIRRPCTAEDMATILNLHINEISKILRQLGTEDKITTQNESRGVFYQWKI